LKNAVFLGMYLGIQTLLVGEVSENEK